MAGDAGSACHCDPARSTVRACSSGSQIWAKSLCTRRYRSPVAALARRRSTPSCERIA
ncbi:hypothetical protein J2S48_003698 [Promicromonospora iranensis]|uniref:Uncharacterized protein n=1 Tax=Promicromonospora iranensis TaxID=1105144 RepID=A0ABU2CS68_9MICO|nr:hypothetical protein [Promicromonospora iranensis]